MITAGWRRWLPLLLVMLVANVQAGDGKLIATAGTSSIEGTAGGGIVPWAVLSGYDTRDQTSGAVFATRVDVDDYRMQSIGAAIGFHDRLELSVAHHTFTLKNADSDIEQEVYGAKVRLWGDVVFSPWPQVSVGLQHKRLLDSAIATAVGADNSDEGTDIYLAATKVHLGLVAGYNLLWDVTLRNSRANQLGLLGFGGDRNRNREWLAEGSVALLLSRNLALGMDYRQKPDNLSFAREDDWADIFVAWFPSKRINLTAAWADLGSIAGADNQRGLYVSVTAYGW